ncbi:MAG: sulfite exporter TauE/SafE family protein [Krumholzibacteria bacterium]|nr:sulfite exporter TauE/SafE family protein [Candidatus Krumholzibacteria bacterium]
MPETIFSGPLQYALTCAVLVLAQIVYVLFGFGSGLVALGLLALLFPDIKDPVVVLLLVNLPAEVLLSWRARREVRWKPIAILGVGIAAGIPVGTRLLNTTDTALAMAALGWFLIAVGLVFLRLPARRDRDLPGWLAVPTGLASGVLNGLFGAGGPPVIIWYHLTAPNKTAFRGSLMTLFLLMGLIRVPVYALSGLVTPARLVSMLAVLPAVLLGAWIGDRIHIRLSDAAFRRLVAGALAVLGMLLLLKK